MINLGSISINIFSLILGFCILLIFLRDGIGKKQFEKLLILAIVLDISQIQGYFIRFGLKEVSYEDAYMAFFLIYSLIVLSRTKVKKKLALLSIALIVVASFGFIYEFIIPFPKLILNGDAVGGWDYYVRGETKKSFLDVNIFRFCLIFFRIIEYSAIAVILKSSFSSVDYRRIYNCLLPWSKGMIFYGIIEFITKNVFNSGITNKINEILLGIGGSTFTFGEKRMGLYTLQGMTREQSHYALSLFFAFIFLYVEFRLCKKSITKYSCVIHMFLSVVLMILSGAFSAIVYISIIVAMLLMINTKKLRKQTLNIKFASIMIIGIIVIAVSFFLPKILGEGYWGERLARIYKNLDLIVSNRWKGHTFAYSEIVRFVSISDTFKDFLCRPLFGLGCGVEWAHSGVVSMLSAIGIIGSLLWARISSYSSNGRIYMAIMVVLVIVPNLVCGSVDMMISPIVIVLLEINDVLLKYGSVNKNISYA